VVADHPSRLLVVLQGEDATVTVVHSKTQDAQAICAEADILIAAIGKPEMVKADWVKPGAAVIDVGTNPIPVSLPIMFVSASMKEGG
jgi:methylenetetrahydrofolate dehydrogenase (NADP+)/methenyltetrahydrofolate cyclohydrolase